MEILIWWSLMMVRGADNFTDSGLAMGMNNSISIALSDVDSDGDLDIVVANSGLGNRVYFNE